MALIDQFGNPIQTKRLTQEEAGPTLTGVRQVISGHPAQGLTPQRLAALLRAAENGDEVAYLELAEEMEEKDLHYRSVLATRKNQVASIPITVESASDDPDDVKAADLVREALRRPSLQLELFDVLDAIGKGFSIVETIWDTSDGRWMPKAFRWRDPRWFTFDRTDGETPLLRDLGQPQPLKSYGFLTHIHKSKSGLPIRGGLARVVAWFYLFKNFGVRSWVEFAEIYGKPIRLGKYASGAKDADKDVLLDAVRSIMADAAAIIPDSMKIDLIEAKISGNVDLHERLADWMDRQVSKAVLGQTGTTDTGTRVGTANAHERVREDIEQADGVQLGCTLTEQLARPVVDLNMGPRPRYPTVVVRRPDPEDTTALVDNVVKLVPFGLRVERSWMADKLGVPDPDLKAELLAAPAAQPAPEPSSPPVAAASQSIDYQQRLRAMKERRQGPPGDDDPDSLDELAAAALEDWEEQMDPILAPLRQALAESSSYEAFLARLPALVAQVDASKLAEALAKAAFVARLAGETDTAL